MWLCNSSVGRKVVMSLTGIALVLFLTFHGSMNVVALVGKEYYNDICEFLGSHWYAVGATVILAALVAIHFIYAIWLTLQNKKARGNNAYAVTDRPDKVEWASQNMLVLGFIVVLGLLLHLYNFWYNMMGAELFGFEGKIEPTNGYDWIVETFSCPVYAGLYIVWLIALWFHLTHGIWSAMQTLGLSGKIWFKRWKKVSNIWSTLVVLMFVAVIAVFAVKANCCKGCEATEPYCVYPACTEHVCGDAACEENVCPKQAQECKHDCANCENKANCPMQKCEGQTCTPTTVNKIEHNHEGSDKHDGCDACKALEELGLDE